MPSVPEPSGARSAHRTTQADDEGGFFFAMSIQVATAGPASEIEIDPSLEMSQRSMMNSTSSCVTCTGARANGRLAGERHDPASRKPPCQALRPQGALWVVA